MLRYEDVRRVHIELSSYCNSSCPSCPRNTDGGVTSHELAPSSLSLEDVKKVLPTDLLARLTSMNMCGNYGDPIMCKDMIDIMKYIQKYNPRIKLGIHTNGGVRSLDFWRELGEIISAMPNTHILFGIDGLEDTNHLHRIGVEWSRLMSNVEAYIAAGGNAVWDFLIFKHNEHQVDLAEQLSKDMGFTRFIRGVPHGFKFNGKMRVVDKSGKFITLLSPSTTIARPTDSTNSFEKIDYDVTLDSIKKNYENTIKAVVDKNHELYQIQQDKFAAMDDVEVKECTAVMFNEIYIDSDGGIHPCCYLGHISQDASPIAELVWHKKWIEDTIGFANINALNKPIKDIMESYFPLIKDSWTKTFAQGRNPMCVLKCGIQRPNGEIRSTDFVKK